MRGGDRLVNAVLRRASADGLPPLPGDDTPEDAAITHSVPRWLAERWFAEFGPDEARQLLARINEPAERAIRVNTLRASVDDVREALGVPTHGDDELPDALVLDEALDLEATELWARGAIVAQARGAQLAAHLLAPAAGSRCSISAPHLAARPATSPRSWAVARDSWPSNRTVGAPPRCGARSTGSVPSPRRSSPAMPSRRRQRSAAASTPSCSTPCAALGTLQRQPDVRWRATPDRIDELAATQRRMLEVALPLLAPGGRLLYSVCSLGPAESDDVLAAVGASPTWRRTVLPHRDRTDGFEYALIHG